MASRAVPREAPEEEGLIIPADVIAQILDDLRRLYLASPAPSPKELWKWTHTDATRAIPYRQGLASAKEIIVAAVDRALATSTSPTYEPASGSTSQVAEQSALPLEATWPTSA